MLFDGDIPFIILSLFSTHICLWRACLFHTILCQSCHFVFQSGSYALVIFVPPVSFDPSLEEAASHVEVRLEQQAGSILAGKERNMRKAP